MKRLALLAGAILSNLAVSSVLVAAIAGNTSTDRSAVERVLLDRLIAAVDQAMGEQPPIVAEVKVEVFPVNVEGVVVGAPTRSEEELIRWRGGQWLLLSARASEISDGIRLFKIHHPSRSISVAGVVQHSDEHMLEVLLQREGFAGWAAVPSLARELRECEVRWIDEQAELIRCEYVLPRAREVMSQPHLHVVDVAPGPRARVVTIALAAWDVATDEWGPRMHSAATEWTELDGRPIPRVVERYRPGHSNMIRCTLVSARIVDADEAATWSFAPPREPGWSVQDSRLRLEYVIGERIVTVAGQRYRLAEPILEHPGDRLAELLESAEALDGAPESR